MTKAIVLLSGGLDSYVVLDYAVKKYDEVFALFFDYGQKALKEEKEAFKKMIKKYSIKGEVIKLSFLKNITKNSLTVDELNDFNELKSVWVPNRNALFISVAGSYCDSFGFDYILFGANKDESSKFSDNRENFVDVINECFKYSTMKHPKVVAPCVNMTKVDLINYALDNNMDLKLIKSCYQGAEKTQKKHCAKCMSCKLLYNAIKNSNKPELIKEIF